MEIRQLLTTWKNVFGNWRYAFLAILIAVFFYSLNVLILGWKSLLGFYSSAGFLKTANLFFVLFLGFKDVMLLYSFTSLIVISILFGILFSMLAYKTRFNLSFQDKKVGIMGGIGVFLAAFIPGCAACGVGLASALGFGAGILSFLPYDGIELSILAIIILSITIFKTTKNMYVCMVPNISKDRKQLRENKFSVKRVKRI